ncbi:MULTISPECIES: alpha/beta fold hydrolase [Synechococcaceae]|uniref:alpha/beta fold hydrolase n=1 Tax=Synechococcaceae TaxID=1890426 RepID=UPI001F17410C|nr:MULTISPECIES: alpha/beta hydrolase [Synechococcaceae]MCT4365508.1 alpha/beta hydrolase [Candidatus Regnicoccus frigidus MAG-AL1]MCT4368145.1 alpha/beta hydrolase [Candidatus Regnicoccus frigidus MAG-AL2]
MPLFVFLPGMDGSAELLRPQLAGLKAAFDIRCLSIPADDLTGWDGLIQQIANLISREKKRSPSRPLYLCGESFGGCLALKLAAHFPRLCDRLILINPASSASRQPWIAWGASVSQRLPSSLYRLSSLGLLPFLIAPQKVSILSQRNLLAAMQSVSPPSAAWRLSLLSQFNLEALPLERIEQPVLVLASRADRLLPSVEEAARLGRYLPNSQTVLLPGSGHAFLLEKENRFSHILKPHNFCVDRNDFQLTSPNLSARSRVTA